MIIRTRTTLSLRQRPGSYVSALEIEAQATLYETVWIHVCGNDEMEFELTAANAAEVAEALGRMAKEITNESADNA